MVVRDYLKGATGCVAAKSGNTACSSLKKIKATFKWSPDGEPAVFTSDSSHGNLLPDLKFYEVVVPL